MAAVLPRSVTLEYRDEIVAAAREFFPGEVGVSLDGFAGRMLPKNPPCCNLCKVITRTPPRVNLPAWVRGEMRHIRIREES
jgi:hypothetical protein